MEADQLTAVLITPGRQVRQIDMASTDATAIPPGHSLICARHLAMLCAAVGVTEEQFIAMFHLIDERNDISNS